MKEVEEMYVKVERKELLNKLKLAKLASGKKRGVLPILSNVEIGVRNGELFLRSTDLEKFLTIRVHADVNMFDGFRAVVNLQKIIDFLSKSSSTDVWIEDKGNYLEMMTGGAWRVRARFYKNEEVEFPEFPEPEVKIGIGVGHLLAGAKFVEDFIKDSKDTNPVLSNMLIHIKGNDLAMVGSNGHILAVYRAKVEYEGEIDEIKILVPKGSIKAFIEAIETNVVHLELGVDESKLHLINPEVIFSTRLGEGEYPDYEAVIPREFNVVMKVDADMLIEQVKQIVGVAGKSSALVIELEGGELRLSAHDPETGEVEANMEVEVEKGEGIKFGINPNYLLTILGNYKSGIVRVGIVDDESPVVFTKDGEEEGSLCLAMPMRV